MFGYIFLAGLVWTVQGAPHCGTGSHPACTIIDPAEVDHAIVDVSLHYNNDMCLELLMIDCAKHVTQGDEVICASNGKTYDNHCRFIHARCEYYLVGVQPEITKVSSGPCLTGTTMAAVTGTVAVTVASNTTGSGSTIPTLVDVSTTMAPMTGTADTASTMAASGASAVSTDIPVTTTPAGPTTTSINNMIQQLFCRNVDSVVCSQDFNIVCATDGQFYPNSCELSKAKCKDLSLTSEPDTTKCTVPGK